MDNKAAPPKPERTRFSTLNKYFRKYRGYLIFGIIAVTASNALALGIPYITKIIFDLLDAGGSSSELMMWIGVSVGLAVLSGAFRFFMRRTIIWMSRHIEYDLRGEIFDHLLSLSMPFFHQTRTGDIMARMTNDLEAVRQMIGPGIMYIASTAVTLVIAFSVMAYLSMKLVLLALIPLVALPIGVYAIGTLLHRQSVKVQGKFAELTVAAQENLSGIRVVKAYRQEKQETESFRTLSSDYLHLNMTLAKLQGLFLPAMRLVASLSYLIVLYYGGLEVINGQLALGDVVAFFGYLSMILWPLIAIGWVTSLYQRGKASLDRINRILFTDPIVRDEQPGLHDDKMTAKIEFRKLSFSYGNSDDSNVLHEIDLTIEPGQMVGIIGPTGSGKSTLVSLLARLYPVPTGQLFIGDRDINEWKLESLRRQIGFATQEPFLFSDTIEGNIRFGRSGATSEDVTAAGDIAVLTGDIASFSHGYDTIVGERGITLSGGQKQRTAIARAILRDPAILVLDDATSSVDTETEHHINERIKEVLKGRTSLVISHRVASVKDADRIVYLDGGRIVEQGSHEELLAAGGRYAELYRYQLIEAELESL